MARQYATYLKENRNHASQEDDEKHRSITEARPSLEIDTPIASNIDVYVQKPIFHAIQGIAYGSK
jgi:hypothetical protein